MSKSKQKGTLAESAVVQFLQETWPAAERRALAGVNDKGDVSGIPDIVIEVKNQKTYKIAEWLKETEAEKKNANAKHGFLVVKPNGVGVSRTQNWWVVLTLAELVELLKEAGFAQGLQPPND